MTTSSWAISSAPTPPARSRSGTAGPGCSSSTAQAIPSAARSAGRETSSRVTPKAWSSPPVDGDPGGGQLHRHRHPRHGQGGQHHGRHRGLRLDGTTIGGTTALARNVISGNRGSGVVVEGDSAGTLVEGNYVGIDPTGTQPLGNAGSGVSIDISPSTTIGGSTQDSGNVISANAQAGVSMQGSARSEPRSWATSSVPTTPAPSPWVTGPTA